MTVHLLVGQPAGLVEHLGRDRELADVVHEQAEAELAHAVVEAVVAAAAAVVGPAVRGPGAAGDQQPEHGDLDAVAVGVVVEGGEVVERQRRVGAVEQVLDHRAGHVGERLDDACAACPEPLRSAPPAAVIASPVARCTFARVSGVSGSATSIVAAEVVLDPDRPDAGLRQQRRVVRGQLDARPAAAARSRVGPLTTSRASSTPSRIFREGISRTTTFIGVNAVDVRPLSRPT